MSEPEVLTLEKQYGDHSIVVLMVKKDSDSPTWDIMMKCEQCETHHSLFNEVGEMVFVDLEAQMHAAGLENTWHDGIGFMLEDNA